MPSAANRRGISHCLESGHPVLYMWLVCYKHQYEMLCVNLMLQALQSNYDRPWQSVVPPLEQSVEIVEKYPSDEEENGMVVVGWRGPLAKVILNCMLN